MQKSVYKKTSVQRHKRKAAMPKKPQKPDVFFMLRRYLEQAALHVLRALSAPELVPVKASVRRTRAQRRKK